MLTWLSSPASDWLKLVNFPRAAMLQTACFFFFFLDTSYCNRKYCLLLRQSWLIGCRTQSALLGGVELKGSVRAKFVVFRFSFAKEWNLL